LLAAIIFNKDGDICHFQHHPFVVMLLHR
jgi:hypothetical protein